MGQRNMLYTIPTHDTVTEQEGHLPTLPPNNFNSHGPLPYGITPYHHDNTSARVFPNHDQGQFNGAFKRKVFPGNFHYFYPAPNDIPLVIETGPHHTSVRNRASGAIVGVDPHTSGHLVPGNYGALQVVPTPWLDHQFCGNTADAAAFSWNHAPRIPYIQGCINGGGMEAANMGPHGYQVMANGNSGSFVHQVHHNLHHVSANNIDYSRQASTSRRLSTNSVNPFQNGPRFMGPTRVYHPHRGESTARHRSFPHLRLLPEDGVAILDISGYHRVGHSVDHHRDMRLDIDHMSYEELLALGEQIGSVGSGLSDYFIVGHLKTRIFTLSKSSSHTEHFCVICQTDYNEEEKIGVVDCGHEYHVDCIKKWLVVENTCPVCKSTALES